jgi:hypothetical protein
MALAMVSPLVIGWPGAATAEPGGAARAAEMIAAYQARIHEAMGNLDGRCPRGGDDHAIVVCGRARDYSMHLPSRPEPGAPPPLIPGEVPTGMDAMTNAERCLRLCEQPVVVPIIPAVRALARGLGRILHPD